MANSGTIIGSKTGQFGVEIDWSAVQNVADNTSTITVNVYITYYSIDINARTGGQCTIDNTSYTYTTSAIEHNAGASYRRLVATKVHTVEHNADGTRKCSISASFPFNLTSYNNGYIGTLSASAEVELNTIARASTITKAEDKILGNACSVKWTPASAAFRYKLKFSLGDWSYTTNAIHPNKTSAYTYTGYKIPVEVAEQIPDDFSGTMTVALYTYSDSEASVQIGSVDTETFTITVPGSAKPEVSMTLSPVSDLGEAFDGLYIQSKTKVKAALSATGKYKATIESYYMAVEGNAYYSDDSYISDFLAKYGTTGVYGYAKDSRGYTGAIGKNITVIPYSKPKILAASGESDVVAARCDANGNLSDSGTYLKIKAKRSYSLVEADGVQKNFCKIRYRYKIEGGSYGSWTTILASDNADSDEIVTGALLDGALSVQSTHLVQVQAIDDIGESSHTTITVPTEKVYWHRDGKRRSFQFGGYVEDDNTFGIAEDITFKTKGPIDARGGGNVLCLLRGIKLTATADSPLDADNLKTPGNYYSPNAENSQNIANIPYTDGGFVLMVRELQTADFIRQEIIYGRNTWARHYDGASWSKWWRYQTTTVEETAAVDYIIETGTSGGWTYKKWKGGSYEMFGTFEVTPPASTLRDTLYRTDNMTIDLPFTISSAYVSGTAVGHYWLTNAGISGDSKITLRLMGTREFDTTTAIEVRLTVVGTYE